jgi:hypothetical protein
MYLFGVRGGWESLEGILYTKIDFPFTDRDFTLRGIYYWQACHGMVYHQTWLNVLESYQELKSKAA